MTFNSVSTSWRSEQIPNSEELVAAIKNLGVNGLELEFRISEKIFREIMKNLHAWGITVHSLHAVCPSAPGRRKGAERHPLGDADEEARKLGVRDVIATLWNAAEIGARAVVVHCGYVDMDPQFRRAMFAFADAGRLAVPEVQGRREAILHDRSIRSKRNFGFLLKSLEEINEAAVKLNIDVGLENRYYINEFPFFEEFGVIFNLFDGGRLGYWHDTGHAQVMETLYGIPHEKLLETFSDRLIGVHLHDVRTPYTDHNEPGCGNVDFEMVKGFLRDTTIRVMELSHRVSNEGARNGVAFLREKGIF